MIGYFEGIESERGIAWRLNDSLRLRRFLGIALDEDTPDHSTISRTRRLIDLETLKRVFSWVLGLLADRALLQGQRIGIDATIRQRIQRLMLAAPRTKTIREAEKVFLVNLID